MSLTGTGAVSVDDTCVQIAARMASSSYTTVP
jgi:hypothetical protein